MSRKNNLAQIWAERIKACQASGINVKAWCGENNVSASQYYYWIRKLNNSSNELVGDEQAGHFMPRKDPRKQVGHFVPHKYPRARTNISSIYEGEHVLRYLFDKLLLIFI